MGFFSSAVGGNLLLAWAMAFLGCLFGYIPAEQFQQFTMAFMVAQAVESGISKNEGDAPTIFTKLLAGRKFLAFVATSFLLVFRGYAAVDWMQVAAVYGFSEALEKGVFVGTNGLQKLVAGKTAGN